MGKGLTKLFFIIFISSFLLSSFYPDATWIVYGQEIIGAIQVLESGQAFIKLKQFTPTSTITSGITGFSIFNILNTNLSLIISLLTLSLVCYFIIRINKKKLY